MAYLLTCLSCSRTEPRGSKLAIFCFECAEQRRIEQRRALMRVREAVKRGHMQPARAHDCVDCGAPASGFDHRDYTLPLQIEPVCAACNKRRGPALDSQMRALPEVA